MSEKQRGFGQLLIYALGLFAKPEGTLGIGLSGPRKTWTRPRAVALSLPRLPRQFTTQAIQADNHPSRWGTGLCPLLLCFIFDENLCTALSRVRHVAQQHLEAWNLTVSQPMTGHVLALMSHWGAWNLWGPSLPRPQPPQTSVSSPGIQSPQGPNLPRPQPPQAPVSSLWGPASPHWLQGVPGPSSPWGQHIDLPSGFPILTFLLKAFRSLSPFYWLILLFTWPV